MSQFSGPMATHGTTMPGAGEGAGKTLVIVAAMMPNSVSQTIAKRLAITKE